MAIYIIMGIIPIACIVLGIIFIAKGAYNTGDEITKQDRIISRLIVGTSTRLNKAGDILDEYIAGCLTPTYYGDQFKTVSATQTKEFEDSQFEQYMASLDIVEVGKSIEIIEKNKRVLKEFMQEVNRLDRNVDQADFRNYKMQGGKMKSWERYSLQVDDEIKQIGKKAIPSNWNFIIYYRNRKINNKYVHTTYNFDNIKKWYREHT